MAPQLPQLPQIPYPPPPPSSRPRIVEETEISLRDYFAGQVLNSLVADTERVIENHGNRRQIAEVSYLLADEMLRARKS